MASAPCGGVAARCVGLAAEACFTDAHPGVLDADSLSHLTPPARAAPATIPCSRRSLHARRLCGRAEEGLGQPVRAAPRRMRVRPLDRRGGGSIRSLRQTGAVSSDGESVRFTPGRSQVRVLHRPPDWTPSRIAVDSVAACRADWGTRGRPGSCCYRRSRAGLSAGRRWNDRPLAVAGDAGVAGCGGEGGRGAQWCLVAACLRCDELAAPCFIACRPNERAFSQNKRTPERRGDPARCAAVGENASSHSNTTAILPP